jgi:hypothetical protein
VKVGNSKHYNRDDPAIHLVTRREIRGEEEKGVGSCITKQTSTREKDFHR